MSAARTLCAVLGVLCGGEFTSFHVACVQFGVLLPLLGQVVHRENGRYRADRNASTAVNALHRIDIELRDLIEPGAGVLIAGVLLRMDAIYLASVDTGGVFYSNTGLSNDVSHTTPPPFHAMRFRSEFNKGQAR